MGIDAADEEGFALHDNMVPSEQPEEEARRPYVADVPAVEEGLEISC